MRTLQLVVWSAVDVQHLQVFCRLVVRRIQFAANTDAMPALSAKTEQQCFNKAQCRPGIRGCCKQQNLSALNATIEPASSH